MLSNDTTVSMSQIGPDGQMRAFDLINVMQDCTLLWLGSEPAMADWMEREGIIMVATFRQADIVRRPRYGEKLHTETSVYATKSYLGYRDTWVFDEAGEPVAKSWCMGAWVDKTTGKAVRIPADVIDAITIDPEREMEKAPRKVKLPKADPAPLPDFAVRRSEADLYGHVNNTRYIRMAWDFLPEGFAIARICVEYKSQARPGDRIYPVVYETDDGFTYVLKAADDTVYSVIKFS